jgi:RNA polymerase sigma-70 factor (ECF subfamily)
LALDDYPVFHVVRADLLRRVGRSADAVAAYDAAIARTENVVEREFLLRKRAHF